MDEKTTGERQRAWQLRSFSNTLMKAHILAHRQSRCSRGEDRAGDEGVRRRDSNVGSLTLYIRYGSYANAIDSLTGRSELNLLLNLVPHSAS